MKLEKYYNEFLDYLESERNASHHTLKNYEGDFKIFLSFLSLYEISMEVDKIETTDIRKYIVYLKKHKNYANETIRRKINSLKSYFNFLISQDYIIQSPMRGITAPKKETRIPKYFTEDQVKLIFNTAKQSEANFALRNYILIKLIATTGIRRQEAIDLNFNNIDFGKNTIKVKGKGRKERLIPMNSDFSEELWIYFQSRLPLKNQAVFITSTGNRLHSSQAHILFVEVLKKIGLNNKGLSLHSLRHSYATMLVNNGVDIAVIQELLGHQDINTTTIYAHATKEHLREEVAKLPY